MNTAAATTPVHYVHWYESPVGPLLADATDHAVCGLFFCDAERLAQRTQALRQRYAGAVQPGRNALLETLGTQLEEYFSGARREFTLPLSSPGSAFQERVWAALCEIPYGQTWSYLQLALRIGDRLATRAVGLANGANPIPILIPCHRVINADGGDGGFGGGSWRKRILLDLEHGQGTLQL